MSYQVNAGDTVAKGDVLAVIDSPDLQNQLQQEQATLDRLSIAVSRQHIDSRQLTLENKKAVDIARVTLTAAQREKRRADKAWQVNAISQIDYEKAQDELENAQLVFEHAEADAQLANESQRFELQTRELELSRQQLLVADLRRRTDALSITSPVAGMVGNLSLQQKNQVTRHQALLSVVDLSAYEVEIAIPESYADDLALGMAAEIHYNGERHAATLIAISPEIQDNQVIGRVRFADSMPAGLRQSQRLTTRVLLENKANVLQVSRGQFINSGAGRVAYKVQDGIAYRTAITIGATSLNAVEIIDGLQLGDRIIISDTEPFASADTVRLTD
ncbi:efflux RND transporter periplasmic adaptor subunit [Idiomarina xiamenensis]|uniref:efflux RND transporter periplasmic adaptor subunit n=1 Tax=Idiomarina xiamenensis TaxID=1207041 RepID=UPI00030660E8